MNGPLRPNETSPESDPLDRLLDLAPMSEPDAWFTVRTLARCRTSGTENHPSLSWSRVWRRWTVAGVFALCLMGLGAQQINRNLTLKRHHRHSVQEAFEVMKKVSNDSDSSWQDSSL
jgi:hypothetical protein